MTTFDKHPGYDQLPKPIRDIYTPEEHAWLSDDEKQNIIEAECYPEDDEE